jgi:exopolysaccharide biosynthesis polyprenyl glycosylphosphotransferase
MPLRAHDQGARGPSTTALRGAQAGGAATGSAPPQITPALEGRRAPRLRIARDLVLDSVVLGAACAVAALTMPTSVAPPSPLALGAFSLATLLLLAARGMYARRFWASYLDDLRSAVVSTGIAAMGVASLSLLLSENVDAANQGLRVWLFAVAYLAAARGATRLAELGLRRHPRIGRPTLIVGEPETARLLARRLQREPKLGLRPVALFGASGEGFESSNGDRPSRNGHPDPGNGDNPADLSLLLPDGDLEVIIREHRIEHAVLCVASPFGEGAREVARRFIELGIAVSMLPQQFDGIPDRIVVERPAGLPLIRVPRDETANWGLAVKYALDRVVAGLLLVLLSPILLLAAVAVALELGRPIFFRQRRVGHRGADFEILKFRTLTGSPAKDGEADADWAEHELSGELADAERAIAAGPGRETHVGHILRTTGIDELPQLINVLRGEMSIMGPRPERKEYVHRFEPIIHRYADRHRVKPGITGWAQVNGLRGKSPLAQRIELDNYYIENWSFWLDLKILLLTAIAVFRGSPEQ